MKCLTSRFEITTCWQRTPNNQFFRHCRNANCSCAQNWSVYSLQAYSLGTHSRWAYSPSPRVSFFSFSAEVYSVSGHGYVRPLRESQIQPYSGSPHKHPGSPQCLGPGFWDLLAQTLVLKRKPWESKLWSSTVSRATAFGSVQPRSGSLHSHSGSLQCLGPQILDLSNRTHGV